MQLEIQMPLFLAGYLMTAFSYYLNHRFIFHGRLPKRTPKLIKKLHRWYAMFHTKHHIHAGQDDVSMEKYAKIPVTGKLVLAAIVGGISAASWGVALGILVFFVVYGIRHGSIHGIRVLGMGPAKKDSYHYRHHMLHHSTGNWGKYNFSGVHPWIDKVFGTYKES